MIVGAPVLRRLARIRREEGLDTTRGLQIGLTLFAGVSPEARFSLDVIERDLTDAEKQWAFETVGAAATRVLSEIQQQRVDRDA